MRINKAILLIVAMLAGCRQTYGPDQELPKSVDVTEIMGFNAIYQVDGHDPPWYHDLGGADCQMAFLTGGLEIEPDGHFLLSLGYDYRCVTNEGVDGSGSLGVQGNVQNRQGGTYVMSGLGPNFFNPNLGVDNWGLSMTKEGDFVTLRFTGSYRDFMADPVLTLGPRSPSVLVR